MTATPHPEAMDETHKAGFSTTQAEDLVELANSLHARSLTWAIGISVTAVVTAFILILIVTLSLNSRFDTGFTTVSNRFTAVNNSINDLNTRTSARIDDLNTRISARIDKTNTRIGDTAVQVQALIRANREHLARIEKLLNERLPTAQ